MTNWPLFREFTGSLTASGITQEVALSVASSRQPVELSQVMVDMVTGSCATFAPLIGNSASFTTNGVNEFYNPSNTTANNKHIGATIGRLLFTDNDGYIYFRPNPVSGGDNSFNYCITVRPY